MDELWIKVFKPVWNTIVNVCYWVVHPQYLRGAFSMKKGIEKQINNLSDIEVFLTKFKYEADSYKDWTPWIITMINKDFIDDCDGAAKLGQWLFKCIGIRSEIYSLRGDGVGHAVCWGAGKYLISNGRLIKDINSKEDILTHFKGKYTEIL